MFRTNGEIDNIIDEVNRLKKGVAYNKINDLERNTEYQIIKYFFYASRVARDKNRSILNCFNEYNYQAAIQAKPGYKVRFLDKKGEMYDLVAKNLNTKNKIRILLFAQLFYDNELIVDSRQLSTRLKALKTKRKRGLENITIEQFDVVKERWDVNKERLDVNKTDIDELKDISRLTVPDVAILPLPLEEEKKVTINSHLEIFPITEIQAPFLKEKKTSRFNGMFFKEFHFVQTGIKRSASADNPKQNKKFYPKGQTNQQNLTLQNLPTQFNNQFSSSINLQNLGSDISSYSFSNYLYNNSNEQNAFSFDQQQKLGEKAMASTLDSSSTFNDSIIFKDPIPSWNPYDNYLENTDTLSSFHPLSNTYSNFYPFANPEQSNEIVYYPEQLQNQYGEKNQPPQSLPSNKVPTQNPLHRTTENLYADEKISSFYLQNSNFLHFNNISNYQPDDVVQNELFFSNYFQNK